MRPKPFREGYCQRRVHNPGRTVTFHQCRFKATHGDYCGIHSPQAVLARQRKYEARVAERYRRDPRRLALRRVRALEREVRRLKVLAKAR